MNKLFKIFLIPFLAPLTIVLTISSLNIDKTTKIKFLIWETQNLNLGITTIVVGITSSIITMGSIFASTYTPTTLKRRVIKTVNTNTQKTINLNRSEYKSREEEPIWSNYTEEEPTDLNPPFYNETPQRNVNEPPPTVAVRFKIKNDSRFSNTQLSNQEDNSIYKEKFKETLNDKTYASSIPNSDEDDWNTNQTEDW
tara:strand:+ start:59 stop:649 length:591 start_codon:yes stop_codon:yes gene_type:complete